MSKEFIMIGDTLFKKDKIMSVRIAKDVNTYKIYVEAGDTDYYIKSYLNRDEAKKEIENIYYEINEI